MTSSIDSHPGKSFSFGIALTITPLEIPTWLKSLKVIINDGVAVTRMHANPTLGTMLSVPAA